MTYPIHCESLPDFKSALLGCLLTIVSAVALAEENNQNKTSKPLKDTQFLGLKLTGADLNSVRSHLWDIGGFLQAKSTIRQRNIDKFYPWSDARDSYYIVFQYNNSGNVVSVKRVYRPYATQSNNKRTAIQTKDIALSLIPALGPPALTKRKGWGGGLTYPSYQWQDESMEITIDREGSEILGNVFIEYKIKTNKRYEVSKNKKS